MKKFLIIFGIIVLLLAGAVFTYIFLYGVPESPSEVFGRFTEAPDRPDYIPDSSDGAIDLGEDGDDTEFEGTPNRLYQLTTKPVAGAAIIGDVVRYVERGTGHVYEIALTGGTERIVSGTTIQRVIRAVFSSNGDRVALTSDNGGSLETMLGTLTRIGGDGGLELTGLPEGAREAGFSPNGQSLNFFIPTTVGGVGYAYDLTKEETKELFSIPLSDVRILWATSTYLFTTPSERAIGYVYRVGPGGLEYVTEGGRGLMAFRHASGTLVSVSGETDIETRDVRTGEVPFLRLFTEKCTAERPGSRVVICASPLTLAGGVYPDDWYKGKEKFSDMILRVDSASSTVKVLSKLEEESGRPIDVLSIGTDTTGKLIHFINKYDGALWMLDLR